MSPISLFVVRADQIARTADRNNPNLNIIGPNHVDNVASPLGEANLQDTDNQWLTIDMQTGRVAGAPNVNPFAQLNLPLPSAANIDIRQYISIARQLADTGLDQGGR